jgi:hypothetical protein
MPEEHIRQATDSLIGSVQAESRISVRNELMGIDGSHYKQAS